MDPKKGYKDIGRQENFQEEIVEARNRMDDREDMAESQNFEYNQVPLTKDGRPVKAKWRKDGTAYYPGMKQDNKGDWYRPQRRASGPREYGPRIIDEVPPYDIVGDVRNTRANITFGQLVNENKKYHSQLRQSAYRPSAINKKD